MLALSLRQGLDQVAALGADYTLTDNQGFEWTATGLLAALTRDHPDHLSLTAQSPKPRRRGGFTRRYHIRRYPV